MNKWRVALLYNQKRPALVSPEAPPDALAECDTPETVAYIERALHCAGHEVIALEADYTLLDTIRQTNPDICFNMARGVNGNERASHVPALLEMLNIPYTGASVLGQARALDKAAAKSSWHDAGLPTPPFQVFHHGDDSLATPHVTFPLIVKPLHEGSGMGISHHSVVHDTAALRERVRWVLRTYQQPALVEHYLPGREFSVGIIGNPIPALRGPLAAAGQSLLGHLLEQSAAAGGYHVLPILEIDSSAGVGQGVYGSRAQSIPPGQKGASRFVCPAHLASELEDTVKRLAVAAFEAIGAQDVACVDIRLDASGQPFLIEIDTVPSFDPVHSRLGMMARAENTSLVQVANEILDRALARHSLPRRPLESIPFVSGYSPTTTIALQQG